jgi:hypothetical protein
LHLAQTGEFQYFVQAPCLTAPPLMPARQLCWLSWWAGLVLLWVLVQRADSVTEEQASVLAQVQAQNQRHMAQTVQHWELVEVPQQA